MSLVFVIVAVWSIAGTSVPVHVLTDAASNAGERHILQAPLNDGCANAAIVGEGPTPFTTLGATTDGPDQPGSACDNAGESQLHNDVWFRYVTLCDGTIIRTCNAVNFDSRIAVYAASAGCPPDAADLLACNDDAPGCSGGSSELEVYAARGTPLLIRVGGFSAGTTGTGTLNITQFVGCAVDSDCDDGNPCTTDTCEPLCGDCINTFNTHVCSDGDPCTRTDQCLGGVCVGGNPNDCDDFSPCTIDTCDGADPDASADGCVNTELATVSCALDDDCANPDETGGGPATCNTVTGLCACQTVNNLNPTNSLCLDLRDAGGIAQGPCTIADSECGPLPDGVLQCTDDNGDPLDGGTCVDQACYAPGEPITVDVELGPTSEAACGAQLFFAWDQSCLELTDVATDPDGELGWSNVLIAGMIDGPGTVDLVLGIPFGTTCNGANGATTGGTIARLTLTATGSCKCGGVWLRDHNPASGVGGVGGALDLVACNDGFVTDEMQIQGDPHFDCPADDVGHADCGAITRSLTPTAVTLTDGCTDLSTTAAADVCTVAFHQACATDLDCGFDPTATCATDAECGGDPGDCVADAVADGFSCDGNLPCIGFCRQDTCTAGFCNMGIPISGTAAEALLAGDSLTLPPGAFDVACSHTNGCGRTASCAYRLANNGRNEAVVDVELSPTLLPGTAGNPIVRCLRFELGVCGATTAPLVVDTAVEFGLPSSAPGHGTARFDVPPGNWDCITATDPRHSLTAACTLTCAPDNTLYAEFKGSKELNPTCGWLTQGNLDWPDPHIDILDFTIFAWRYLELAPNGNDTPCGATAFDADFNADGLVTIADFGFIVTNFFCASKDPCRVICDPGPGESGVNNRAAGPRGTVTLTELQATGWGELAGVADANGDGFVDISDMAAFVGAHADDDPVLAAELARRTEKLRRTHRQRPLSTRR